MSSETWSVLSEDVARGSFQDNLRMRSDLLGAASDVGDAWDEPAADGSKPSVLAPGEKRTRDRDDNFSDTGAVGSSSAGYWSVSLAG